MSLAPLVVTLKNVYGHCQISPGGVGVVNCPSWEPLFSAIKSLSFLQLNIKKKSYFSLQGFIPVSLFLSSLELVQCSIKSTGFHVWNFGGHVWRNNSARGGRNEAHSQFYSQDLWNIQKDKRLAETKDIFELVWLLGIPLTFIMGNVYKLVSAKWEIHQV